MNRILPYKQHFDRLPEDQKEVLVSQASPFGRIVLGLDTFHFSSAFKELALQEQALQTKVSAIERVTAKIAKYDASIAALIFTLHELPINSQNPQSTNGQLDPKIHLRNIVKNASNALEAIDKVFENFRRRATNVSACADTISFLEAWKKDSESMVLDCVLAIADSCVFVEKAEKGWGHSYSKSILVHTPKSLAKHPDDRAKVEDMHSLQNISLFSGLNTKFPDWTRLSPSPSRLATGAIALRFEDMRSTTSYLAQYWKHLNNCMQEFTNASVIPDVKSGSIIVSTGKGLTFTLRAQASSLGEARIAVNVTRDPKDIPQDCSLVDFSHRLDFSPSWGVVLDFGDVKPQSIYDLAHAYKDSQRNGRLMACYFDTEYAGHIQIQERIGLALSAMSIYGSMLGSRDRLTIGHHYQGNLTDLSLDKDTFAQVVNDFGNGLLTKLR